MSNKNYNLKISITQNNQEIWESDDKYFPFLDGAIDHFSLLNGLLELVSEKENQDWGTYFSNQDIVNRLTDYVREKVSPISLEETNAL